MPYNGSGVFSPTSADNPVVPNTLIESTKFNNTITDVATGLSTAITKDGQTTVTANIPFNGNKITGIAAATARTDAASLATIQDGTGVYVATVGGTADVITLTPSPSITAYAAGQAFYWIASGTNTTNVTVAINGLAAKAITKNGSTALIAGDITSGALIGARYDGTRFQIISAIGAASVGTSNLQDSSVTNEKLAFDGGAFSYRNKIIGGDFTTNPFQRGTTFAAAQNGQFVADRWAYYTAPTGVVTALRTIDAPTATQAGLYTKHCLHVDVTTADAAIAAGDLSRIETKVEGVNSISFGFGQSGTRYVTLSFWHKHTKTGVNCVAFQNDALDRSYIAEYTQAVSDTWEKSIVTIAVDTTGTWLYGDGANNVGVAVIFSIAIGSTFQTTAGAWQAGNYYATSSQVNNLDSTSNNFKIALVQLESGQTATPFETTSHGEVLQLCQRYYEKSYDQGVDPGTVTNVGAEAVKRVTAAELVTVFNTTFKVNKARIPAVTWYSPVTGTAARIRNTVTPADVTVTGTSANSPESMTKAGVPTHAANGAAAGEVIIGHWTANAEI